MKKGLVFILIAVLAFAMVPIAASPPGVAAPQVLVSDAPAIPVDLFVSIPLARSRRGSRSPGSREPKLNTNPGDPPEEGGDPDPELNEPRSGPRAVKAGKTRRFMCVTGCYWDQTRYRTAEELGKDSGDVVEFVGPTQIPPSFQFDNWREF